MRRRLDLMLEEDGVTFPGWDQDAAAAEEPYHEEDPGAVALEYAQEIDVTAAEFDAVESDEWAHRGSRAGTAFTVETLAIYLLHDIEHHLYDVTS